MAHQLSLPGMPFDGVLDWTVKVRLWGDVCSGYIAVASGPTIEDCSDEACYCSTEYPEDEIEHLVHGLALMLKHAVRRAAGPFPLDCVEALEEADNLFGHLTTNTRHRAGYGQGLR